MGIAIIAWTLDAEKKITGLEIFFNFLQIVGRLQFWYTIQSILLIQLSFLFFDKYLTSFKNKWGNTMNKTRHIGRTLDTSILNND